jgi:UDP-2-acetamido-3-amino-2,3-dideoxy-glucuronate N-acetyltransferase
VNYFAHPTAIIEAPCSIGQGTKIWHFTHVMPRARIGCECVLGQNVYVGSDVTIGNNVRIQNNVSVYDGVELEDFVFCGPSCVFTNDRYPRSEFLRQADFLATRVRRGATLGANSTILCGVTIGRYAFISAGAVITKDVPDYALMLGSPALQRGWMSRHGQPLVESGAAGGYRCPTSGWLYQVTESKGLRCIDWPEDQALLS